MEETKLYDDLIGFRLTIWVSVFLWLVSLLSEPCLPVWAFDYLFDFKYFRQGTFFLMRILSGAGCSVRLPVTRLILSIPEERHVS